MNTLLKERAIIDHVLINVPPQNIEFHKEWNHLSRSLIRELITDKEYNLSASEIMGDAMKIIHNDIVKAIEIAKPFYSRYPNQLDIVKFQFINQLIFSGYTLEFAVEILNTYELKGKTIIDAIKE